MLESVVLRSIGIGALIVFMYVATALVAFVVVGVLAQRMKLDRKMPPKRLNFFVYSITAVLWLGFIFLLLNDWAVFMWNEHAIRNW